MNNKVSLFWYYSALLGSLSLLAIAYFYFQLQQGLYPCPLCMIQRACLVIIAVIALIGLVHRPFIVGHRIYASLISLSAIAGMIVAGRQVWLQHLPKDKVPECGFDPIYRWSQSDGSYGLFDMLGTTLKGSGDCAEIDWTLFNFSMAEWMFGVFSVMTLIGLYQLVKPRFRNS